MKRLIAALVLAIMAFSFISAVSAAVGNSMNGSGNAFGERFREQRNDFKNQTEELRKQMYENREELKNETAQLRELRKQAFEDFKDRIRNNSQIDIEGRNVTVHELDDDQKEIIADKINAKTGLNLTVEDINNGSVGSILRAHLSNGRWAMIKTMPNVAALVAAEKMKTKCEDRNCTVELKEIGKGNQTRLTYEVTTQKDAKFLWLFNRKMLVKADVDAETGQVISMQKPWWAFMAREKNVDNSTQG